jgi:hypothetical protein
MVLTLALGTAMSAAADDHNRHQQWERHKKIERHERDRHHERERWAREHRDHKRIERERDHHNRDAMHRWDRDHHRRPVSANRHELQHKGWDNGRKTGWHGQPTPPSHQANEHHYDRRVTPQPASQRVVRPQPDNHIAQTR